MSRETEKEDTGMNRSEMGMENSYSQMPGLMLGASIISLNPHNYSRMC